MKKAMASLAIFVCVVFCSVGVFSQENEEGIKTVVSGTVGFGSTQHEFDTGESEFHHPISFSSVKVEREFNPRISGCVEVLGQFSLTKKSPNKGERLEVGACLVYKPIKTIKFETLFTYYRMREYSVRKFSIVASKEFEFKKGSLEVYNNFMVFNGSKEHQKTGFLNKFGVSATFKLPKKVKVFGDLSVGLDNAPLEFEDPGTTLFGKLKAERKLNKNWSIFGEWRYSKPFTETRHPVSSFQVGLNFHF